MLQGRTYVPMLHARLAEMRAIRELPDNTKNKIFPIIKARPWLSARSLDKLWEVISDSFDERSFALDLDRTKLDPNSIKPAYREFSQLFNPDGAFKNYYTLVENLDRSIPVLRNYFSDPLQLSSQLDQVEKIDRGLIVRILSHASGPLAEIAGMCAERAIENIVFVIDCGWGRDILTQSAVCVGLIERIFETNEDFEIVVGGSSFPDSFSKQGDRFYTSIIERSLFREVRRNVNRGSLYYGDWGSTRPPSDPIPMRNIPRIDMPVGSNWLSWRSDGEDDYEVLAGRAVNDEDWSGNLGIWGEYMIESTADGLLPAIKSPAMAAAVRVNMHLHYQANFDSPGDLIVADEPFYDL